MYPQLVALYFFSILVYIWLAEFRKLMVKLQDPTYVQELTSKVQVRYPKLTVAFSQSSGTLMTYRVVAGRGAVGLARRLEQSVPRGCHHAGGPLTDSHPAACAC